MGVLGFRNHKINIKTRYANFSTVIWSVHIRKRMELIKAFPLETPIGLGVSECLRLRFWYGVA